MSVNNLFTLITIFSNGVPPATIISQKDRIVHSAMSILVNVINNA